MAQHRYHAALHERLTHSIYRTLIESAPNSPDGIKALHLHLTHYQIIQVAQEAAFAIIHEPTIGLTLRRLPD